MRKSKVVLLAVAVMLLLIFRMFTFQVPYDEVVIKTTFQKVSDSSIITDPGLKWRWPLPVNDIYRYSTRLQLLEIPLTDQQTADSQVISLQMAMTWTIEDPKLFHVLMDGSIYNADDKLQPVVLGEVKNIFNTYRLDQLVNSDASKTKYVEFETQCLNKIQEQVSQYGVKVNHIGIQRLVLPQEITQSVFDRQISQREKMAANTESSGRSEAAAIRAEANKMEKQIMAFARVRAAQIEAEGLNEAAKEYASFAKDEDLAIFLRKIETIKNINWENATLFLDAEDLLFKNLIHEESLSPKAKNSNQTQE